MRKTFTGTAHHIGNYIIRFEDADHADVVVYSKNEHETGDPVAEPVPLDAFLSRMHEAVEAPSVRVCSHRFSSPSGSASWSCRIASSWRR